MIYNEQCTIPYVPDDIWYLIWKKCFSSFVLKELKTVISIWSPLHEQSEQLLKICTEDKGAIQYSHTDFDKIIYLHRDKLFNIELLDICLNGECLNCRDWGFPCSNMACHGISIFCKYDSLWN